MSRKIDIYQYQYIYIICFIILLKSLGEGLNETVQNWTTWAK